MALAIRAIKRELFAVPASRTWAENQFDTANRLLSSSGKTGNVSGLLNTTCKLVFASPLLTEGASSLMRVWEDFAFVLRGDGARGFNTNPLSVIVGNP